jgi:hypothetical protein
MITGRAKIGGGASRLFTVILALVLCAGGLGPAMAQPDKNGQPRFTPPAALPAPTAAAQPSVANVAPSLASPSARARAIPGGTSLAKLQREKRQLAANLDKARGNVRTLQASNELLARDLNTLRQELLATGHRLLWTAGLALGLLLLPPLFYLLLIQRRLNHLRDLQEQFAREHERQLQDQEALLSSLRGTFQRLDTRPLPETRETQEDHTS